MTRKTCPYCKSHPVALNYYRKDKAYYRTACTGCIHKQRHRIPEVPGWVRSGYKKKDRCDRCNFKFKMADQSRVYYIDGNTNNNNWSNLKTICLNCQIEANTSRWKPGNLQPDF